MRTLKKELQVGILVGILIVGLWGAKSWADVAVIFEVRVPGITDEVLIDGQKTTEQGNSRLFTTSVNKVGSWQYIFSVLHLGVRVDRTVFFKGNEGKIVVEFTLLDFQVPTLVSKILKAKDEIKNEFKNEFKASAQARIQEARLGLRRALKSLNAGIRNTQGEAYWHKRLFVSQLNDMAQVNDMVQGDFNDEKMHRNFQALDKIYRKLFANEEGLEHEIIVALKNAVGELRDATYIASLKDIKARYQKALESLAVLVPRYERTEEARDRLLMGEIVGFLSQSRLAPQVVKSVHARYGSLNSVLQVNERLFSDLFSKEIEKSTIVNDYILGNPTRGLSNVKGKTFVRLLPSQQDAVIEIGMQGTMVSDATSVGGKQGVSVQVQNHTVNSVEVTRRIRLWDFKENAYSISAARAIVVAVPEESLSHVNVQARAIFPFVRKIKTNIGYQRACEQMPLGQAEGRRIAAKKIEDEANAQNVEAPGPLKKIVSDFGSLFQEFYQLPQARLGVSPRFHWLESEPKWIYSKHIRRLDNELSGSLKKPPEFQMDSIDLGLFAHESETSNTFNRQLSGLVVHDTDIQAFARNVFNHVPRMLRVGTHVPRWSTHLIEDHPAIIDYDDGAIRLVLRFDGLRIEAFRDASLKAHEKPFEIHVKYAPKLGRDGIYLERLEEPRLETNKEMNEMSDEMKVFLLTRMSALFADKLYPDGLTPVQGGFFEVMAKLKIREFRCENGWLVTGLSFEGNPKDVLKEILKGSEEEDRAKRPTP